MYTSAYILIIYMHAYKAPGDKNCGDKTSAGLNIHGPNPWGPNLWGLNLVGPNIFEPCDYRTDDFINSELWIGLHSRKGSTTFRWSDQVVPHWDGWRTSAINFRDAIDLQCVTMLAAANAERWSFKDCNETFPALCRTPKCKPILCK